MKCWHIFWEEGESGRKVLKLLSVWIECGLRNITGSPAKKINYFSSGQWLTWQLLRKKRKRFHLHTKHAGIERQVISTARCSLKYTHTNLSKEPNSTIFQIISTVCGRLYTLVKFSALQCYEAATYCSHFPKDHPSGWYLTSPYPSAQYVANIALGKQAFKRRFSHEVE